MDYRTACKILGINRARGLHSAKEMAGYHVDSGDRAKREAARIVLQSTAMLALVSFD